MNTQNPPADAQNRTNAQHERDKDVLIIAGAGTGKTTLLAHRFVELVAPNNDADSCLSASRIAAVTFTRKAAGELRNRIREELLRVNGDPKQSAIRCQRTSQALSELDCGFSGTIHSFALRCLEMAPMESGVSPRFAVEIENHALVGEVIERLKRAQRTQTQPEFWLPSHVPTSATKAMAWLNNMRAVGVDWDTGPGFNPPRSLCDLVANLLASRRHMPPHFPSFVFPEQTWQKKVDALLIKLKPFFKKQASIARGVRAFAELEKSLREVKNATETTKRYNLLREGVVKVRSTGIKRDDFSPDATLGESAWALKKQIFGEDLLPSVLDPLNMDLLAALPAFRELVYALYDDICAFHEVLSQDDILLRLREGLRSHSDIASKLSHKFDHIFVDECQDTDPVQIDILMALAQGRKAFLTIVGDPKQSIFRFRGADISAFGNICEALRARGALESHLTVNFRSRPQLIDVINVMFSNWLGETNGPTVDVATGQVAFEALQPSSKTWSHCSGVLRPFRMQIPGTKPPSADEWRPIERRLLARHVAWILSTNCTLHVDDDNSQQRPVIASDIAVLFRSAKNMNEFAQELRRLGIRAVLAGSNAFSKSPIVTKLAALMGVVSRHSHGSGHLVAHTLPFSTSVPARGLYNLGEKERAPFDEVEDWLVKFRMNRNQKPVLDTILGLIEESCALPFLGLQATGEEDLAEMYRFASLAAKTAREQGLDFDGVARWASGWVGKARVNGPLSDDDQAVRLMTVHQAKGLEFPIVISYDGFVRPRIYQTPAWLQSDDGLRWHANVGGIEAEFATSKAPAVNLIERDAAHEESERRRVDYVLFTRAKELAIVPMPLPSSNKWIHEQLLGSVITNNKLAVERISEQVVVADGAQSPILSPDVGISIPLIVENPKLAFPTAPTGNALCGIPWHASSALPAETSAPNPAVRTLIVSSHVANDPSLGPTFGTAVHRGMNLVLGCGVAVTDAARTVVILAREEEEGGMLFDEVMVANRMERLIEKLKAEGLLDGSWNLQSEYPFARSVVVDGKDIVEVGCIDLLATRGTEKVVVDFKTDNGNAAGYQDQLSRYGSVAG